MKPRIITAILLFISAYSPLFLILAVKDFDFKTTHWLIHPLPIFIMLGLTALSIVILFVTITKMQRGSMNVEIVSVKNRSVDLINYTIPYIISFFGVDLSRPEDIISIIIFLFIMLMLTITSKSVFLNPILAVANYGLYDLEYKYDGKTFSTIILCNQELHTGERYYIRSLTRFLYFVTQKINQEDET